MYFISICKEGEVEALLILNTVRKKSGPENKENFLAKITRNKMKGDKYILTPFSETVFLRSKLGW